MTTNSTSSIFGRYYLWYRLCVLALLLATTTRNGVLGWTATIGRKAKISTTTCTSIVAATTRQQRARYRSANSVMCLKSAPLNDYEPNDKYDVRLDPPDLSLDALRDEQERRRSLRKSAAFSGLDEKDVARMAVAAQEVTVSPLEMLFQQGDQPDAIYIVSSGSFEIVDEKTGSTVGVAGPGEIIGELGVLFNAPRAMSVQASSGTGGKLWRLDAADVLDSINNQENSWRDALKATYTDYFDRIDRAKALRKFPLFKRFSKANLDRIQDDMIIQDYAPGGLVVQQGDRKADAMYFVRSGTFECYSEENPGKVVAEVGEFECFGELGLLLNQKRALSVRATGDDASVWALFKEDFLEDVQDSPVLQSTLDFIKEKYKNLTWFDILLSKISPSEIHNRAILSSRPKKLPVSIHSTIATAVTGSFALFLSNLFRPGFHLSGLFRIYDSSLFNNDFEGKLLCFAFAMIGVSGVFRLPPNSPKIRRLLFEQSAAFCVMNWLVADSNLIMFNGGNTFDLTGGWGAALYLSVLVFTAFNGAWSMETVISEDDGKDVILFGDNMWLLLVVSTLRFVGLLAMAPPYFFGFSNEALETVVKPALMHLPGLVQTGPICISGFISFSMLIATLQFEKKVTQVQAAWYVLFLFFACGMWDVVGDSMDALTDITILLPPDVPGLREAYSALANYEFDVFWGSHVVEAMVCVYVYGIVKGLWKRHGPES